MPDKAANAQKGSRFTLQSLKYSLYSILLASPYLLTIALIAGIYIFYTTNISVKPLLYALVAYLAFVVFSLWVIYERTNHDIFSNVDKRKAKLGEYIDYKYYNRIIHMYLYKRISNLLLDYYKYAFLPVAVHLRTSKMWDYFKVYVVNIKRLAILITISLAPITAYLVWKLINNHLAANHSSLATQVAGVLFTIIMAVSWAFLLHALEINRLATINKKNPLYANMRENPAKNDRSSEDDARPKYSKYIIPLYDYSELKLVVIRDSSNSIKHYKMPEYLKQYLVDWYPDLNGYFIYHTGRENMPIVSLTDISFINTKGNGGKKKKALISVHTSSYFDIYFTHHFTDVPIAVRVSEEEFNGTTVTLRKMFDRHIEQAVTDWFQSRETDVCPDGIPKDGSGHTNHLRNFKIRFLKPKPHSPAVGREENVTTTFRPPGELPNPIGITGIVEIGDYLLLQWREHEGAEPDSLTWAFSGLTGLYDEVTVNGNEVDLNSIIAAEYIDETQNSIRKYWGGAASAGANDNGDLLDLNNFVQEPLSLLVQDHLLYQYELIVLLTAKKGPADKIIDEYFSRARDIYPPGATNIRDLASSIYNCAKERYLVGSNNVASHRGGAPAQYAEICAKKIFPVPKNNICELVNELLIKQKEDEGYGVKVDIDKLLHSLFIPTLASYAHYKKHGK